MAVYTYISYGILIIVGHIREFLGLYKQHHISSSRESSQVSASNVYIYIYLAILTVLSLVTFHCDYFDSLIY